MINEHLYLTRGRQFMATTTYMCCGRKKERNVQFALILYLLSQGDLWLSTRQCNLCFLFSMPNQLAKPKNDLQVGKLLKPNIMWCRVPLKKLFWFQIQQMKWWQWIIKVRFQSIVMWWEVGNGCLFYSHLNNSLRMRLLLTSKL